LSWAFLAAGLAACAPSQQKVEAEVAEAARQRAPGAPTQWERAADSGVVQAGWIESFRDPALTALVIEAQANNRELAGAAANVNRAWALARQAGAALAPDTTLSAGAARSGGVGGSRPSARELSLGAQVSWELDVWGRLRSGQRAAAEEARVAEADFRSAQESLAAAAAKSYFSAIEADLQVAIVRETVGILNETERIVNVKFEDGVGSAQDVSLARSDLATARERLTAVQGSYRDALRALEALLGRYPAAVLEVRTTLPTAPPPPPAGLPSELLERRPDLVAAERRVAAAFNATHQAQAAMLPRIALTSELGGASSSLSGLLNPGNAAWSAGANLMTPIFDGGRLRAEVAVRTAEQEQALAAYGQAAINAFREVENNLDQGVVVEQRIRDLQEAVSEAENAFRIARLRYEEGEEDLLNLLTVQQRVVSARSTLSGAEHLLLEQRVNLNLALGGSWVQ
jgi:NodT family efflux transporter outer membrane factor (OMF) lipoprotein